MNQIAKTCFGNAIRIIDRFHVQKLAFEAVQEIRDHLQKLGQKVKIGTFAR
jgi:transposase